MLTAGSELSVVFKMSNIRCESLVLVARATKHCSHRTLHAAIKREKYGWGKAHVTMARAYVSRGATNLEHCNAGW